MANSEKARDAEEWTIGRLLDWTREFFAKRGLETPRLDAEVLLAHVLRCQRIELYAMWDAEVDAHDRSSFRELVKQRAEGCPAAYLVGYREFHGLRFAVDRNVLIPRPETETLLEVVAEHFPREASFRFLDVGTGSGILAVTLAHAWSEATGHAVDISREALAVAERNAETHGVGDRIQFHHSDIGRTLPTEVGVFDLVVSNPPYVTTAEMAELPPAVRDHEPRQALDGGADGLDVVRRLLQELPSVVRPDGLLLCEIGSRQGDAAGGLVEDSADWRLGEVRGDLSGNPRVLVAFRDA